MSSSAIFVLDVKGKVLISRNYRGDMDLAVIDKFMPLLMEREEEGMNHMQITVSTCTTGCAINTTPLSSISLLFQASSHRSYSPARTPLPT